MNDIGTGQRPPERVRAADTLGTIRRLIRFLGQNRKYLIRVLLLSVATTLAGLIVPSLIGRAVDTVEVSGGLRFDMRNLLTTLLLLGVVFLVSALLSYFQGISAAKLTQNVALDIRNELSSKITRLPLSFLDAQRNGDIMSRLTSDTENVANVVSQTAGGLLSSLLVIVGCAVIMLITNWQLTLICLGTVLLCALLSKLISSRLRNLFRQQQKTVGQLNGQIQEAVAAHKTVQAYDMVDRCVAQTGEVSDQLARVSLRAQILGGLLSPLTCLLGNFNFVLIVLIGGLLLMRGYPGITIGVIQAFTLYSRQFSKPVNELASMYAQFQAAIASAERVFTVLDAPDEPDEGQTCPDLNAAECSVRFEDVSFSYVEGEPVLSHFSAEIRSGQRVALVGATGSGKTTLVSLLLRFYEPDSGRILLNGVDLRDIPKKQLRALFTPVLQSASLMQDTVAANIGYGRRGAGRADIEAMAQTVCADHFIRQLPQGYDTELTGERSQLSQGQQQLLCLARAALKPKKLLILDEAMSAVDTATEQAIQSALLTLSRGQTCLIIAHRLSTIRDADWILVLEDGRVVEQGNHEALFARNGVYHRLYRSNQYAD